jgi:hypothetical protein
MKESIRDIVSEGNDNRDEIPKRNTNALYFPWSPIDDVDIIAGERFASSKDIELSQQKNVKPSK